MNVCKILFFATLKDRAGVRQITLELPDGLTVGGLKAILLARIPALEPALPHAFIAINREYAAEDEIIPPEAEIAVFPPVSGG